MVTDVTSTAFKYYVAANALLKAIRRRIVQCFRSVIKSKSCTATFVNVKRIKEVVLLEVETLTRCDRSVSQPIVHENER